MEIGKNLFILYFPIGNHRYTKKHSLLYFNYLINNYYIILFFLLVNDDDDKTKMIDIHNNN